MPFLSAFFLAALLCKRAVSSISCTNSRRRLYAFPFSAWTLECGMAVHKGGETLVGSISRWLSVLMVAYNGYKAPTCPTEWVVYLRSSGLDELTTIVGVFS